MARKHVNNDGNILDCSTTPEKCEFNGNAGHIDENSSPAEIKEFYSKAEEIAQKAAKRNNNKVSKHGSSKREPFRLNNNEWPELDEYTAEELYDRETAMDRIAMSTGDIVDVRKRNDGAWSKSKGEKESQFSPLNIAKSEYKEQQEKYQEHIDKKPHFDENNMDSDDVQQYLYLEKAKRKYEEEVGKHRAHVRERRKRHLRRLINKEVEPSNDVEEEAIREYRMREGKEKAKHLLKRNERPEYIDSIENKHFTPEGHGSKFTDSPNPTHIISLANAQRNGLEGDDREKLIQAGADPESFLPQESGVRYLMVETPGTESVIDTSTMNDNDTLEVVAKGKNDGKAPSLSFVADVQEQPKTNFGTIIVGPHKDNEGNIVPDTEALWTMHPGSPSRGIRSDTVREHGLGDGDTLTVREFREKFGRDIKANTRITE